MVDRPFAAWCIGAPMGSTRRAWQAGFGVVVLSFCATTFYEGRELRPSEGAVVESKESVIDEVDGKNVQDIRADRSRYVLPPGPHVIAFSVKRVTPGFMSSKITTSNYVRVCLLAAAGHQYMTQPRIEGDSWKPMIVDPWSGPVPIACDRDEVPPVREVRDMWAAATIRRAHLRPRLDFTMNVGAAFGGDNILTAQLSNGDTQTLAAGQGVNFGVGVMVTPLWFRDLVGLGVGGEIGVKYDDVSASNASVSFTRYPAIGTLNVFLRT